jgi:hypothetical protein
MAGWVGWEVLNPLPGKGGTTPNSCVDTQVNLVWLRSNAVLVRDAMGQELKEWTVKASRSKIQTEESDCDNEVECGMPRTMIGQ